MSRIPPQPYHLALNAALRLLGRRDHSCAELRAKLGRRGVADDVAEQVIGECRRLGYLDDERFAAGLLRHCRRRGLGPLRVRQEFHRRGLSAETAERLLAAAYGPEQEQAVARRVAEKKLAGAGGVFERRGREKLQRFLLSRGFSRPAIAAALRELAAEVPPADAEDC